MYAIPADAESSDILEESVTGDRIAYIAVEINAEKTREKIVGFTPAPKPGAASFSPEKWLREQRERGGKREIFRNEKVFFTP